MDRAGTAAGRAMMGTVAVRKVCAFAILACAVAAPVLQAQAPAAETGAQAHELLNSERIERAFGNYGIEVLESDAGIRVSNLYSEADGTRTCRTFAVVRYPAVVHPAFAREHAAVLSGQSIGATFAQSGWTVIKVHRYLGEIESTSRLVGLMGDVGTHALAVHVYGFEIAKEGRRFQYATIAEVHHPAYLGLDELITIYAADRALPAPDASTERLLEIVAAKSR